MPVLGPRPRPGAPWPAGPGGRVGGQGDPQAAEGGRLRQLGRPRQQPPRTDPAPANNRLRPQRSGSYRRRHVRPGPGAGWEMESTRRPHAHQHAGSWRQRPAEAKTRANWLARRCLCCSSPKKSEFGAAAAF